MPFDPDKFLAETSSAQPPAQQTGAAFDPDKFLAETSSAQPTGSFQPGASAGIFDSAGSLASPSGTIGNTGVSQGATTDTKALGKAALSAGVIGAGALAAPAVAIGTGATALATGALGAGLGSAGAEGVKQMISTAFWPDDKDTAKTSSDVGGAMAKSGAENAGGELLGAGVGKAVEATGSAASKGLKSLADYLTTNSVPGAAKTLEKLGGKDAIAKFAQIADDYHVNNISGSARKLADKLSDAKQIAGKALENNYAELDKAAAKNDVRYTAQEALDNIKANYLAKNAKPDLDYTNELSTIDKLFTSKVKNLDAPITHTQLWNLAQEFQKYNVSGGLAKTFSNDFALATRSANQAMAEASASPELVAKMQESSTAWKYLNAVSKKANNAASSSPNSIEKAISTGQYMGAAGAGFAAGSLPGAAIAVGGMALKDVANSVVGKTASASAARVGSDILQYAPQMGKFGKELMRIGSVKGADAVSERHAHLMVDSPQYRDTYLNATSGQ